MADAHPGYFVAPPSGALPPRVLPPGAPRAARLPLLLVLVLALVAVAVPATMLAQRARAADGLEVRAVEAPATAAAGWGPTYVDAKGRPARWDPCVPIAYVVQSGWIPDAGRRDLAEALRRISVASGLSFVDEGDTDEMPSQTRASYQPARYGQRWAPLLIGWVPPGVTDVGVGGGVQGMSLSFALPGAAGPSLVSGQVVLDAGNRLAAGFGPGTTDGEVLLHELAHAVGLGHVLDPTQVMYPQTTSSESEFGAGDRAGLAALGAPAGCHPAPPSREHRRAS